MLRKKLKQYYIDTEDKKSTTWLIRDSHLRIDMPVGSKKFTGSNLLIEIIDQYSGRCPEPIDYELFANSTPRDIVMRPTIILDSQLVSYLHALVSRNTGHYPCVLKFARYVARIGCDYNAMFYLMEAAHKGEKDNYLYSVIPVLESLLTLYCMDEKRFLSSGEIEILPNLLADYCSNRGVSTLRDVAEQIAHENVDRSNPLLGIARLSYAALTKLVLIKHDSMLKTMTPIEKIRLFHEFLANTLGVVLQRELLLGCLYFLGESQKLINVERNTSLTNAKKRLNATAWDLLLLRIPEALLSTSDANEINVGYVATADKSLRELGRLFTLEFMQCGGDRSINPAFSWDTNLLRRRLGGTFQELEFLFFDTSVVRSVERLSKPMGPKSLKELVENLETELEAFCRG